VFNWFTKKKSFVQPLAVDIHSHLLPGLDDGVQTFEDSERIILGFQSMGYRKIITTPHVMSDVYRNTPASINNKLQELRSYLLSRNIAVDIHAAAEYYLDETLVKLINENGALLTFGKNYLLFETNFLSEPFNLKEFIFQATTKGYKLILAHPERYAYLQDNFEKAEDLLNRGIHFQLNINSLTGHYSKPAQKLAQHLIDKGWVHWLATDCHLPTQIPLLKQAMATKYFEKAVGLPLLNNSVL
jgi:protein-tyrosine phosphatase